MDINTILDSFLSKQILVVGDVMTDQYIHGNVSRMSPEAPVAVVDQESENCRIGGAGNVALNLIALGASVKLASVIGQDDTGQQLYSQLQNANVDTRAIVLSKERKTTIKTRVISDGKHLLRIDREDQHDLSKEEYLKIQGSILEILNQGVDGILLEDYNKGVLTKEHIQWLISEANFRQIPIVVDPKKNNFFSYSGCTLFKPNLKELKEGLQIEFELDELNNAIEQLHHRINPKFTFVTLSEYGVQLFDGKNHFHQAAYDRKISDVSGAGDTVIATICLALISGASTPQIAALANLAGGLVCESSGVVSIDKDLLRAEAIKHNI